MAKKQGTALLPAPLLGGRRAWETFRVRRAFSSAIQRQGVSQNCDSSPLCMRLLKMVINFAQFATRNILLFALQKTEKNGIDKRLNLRHGASTLIIKNAEAIKKQIICTSILGKIHDGLEKSCGASATEKQ
jgi:hypothetical protein